VADSVSFIHYERLLLVERFCHSPIFPIKKRFSRETISMHRAICSQIFVIRSPNEEDLKNTTKNSKLMTPTPGGQQMK
jgi:hypothetical protein